MSSPAAPPGESHANAPTRVRRILAERTRALAERQVATEAAAEPGRRIMACRVRTEHYGIHVEAVAAVLPFGRYTSLPAAAPGVLGLFGRAGKIYAIIDLATALGVPDPDAAAGQLLVLRQDSPLVALRVSQVPGMVIARTADMVAPAAAQPGPVSAQILLPPGAIGPLATLVSLIDLRRLLLPFLSPVRPGGRLP